MKAAKIALLIFVLLDVAIALFFLPFHEWFNQFEGYVQGWGAAGPVVMILLYLAATVLLIPGSALTVAAGTLFGLWTGFVVVFVGANLGALCAFLLARRLVRDRVARWAESHPKFRALDRAVGQQGFKMVFLLRLSPAFPFTLLNYLLGLTAVRTAAYVLANVLGMVPGAFLYVYIGAAARDAIAGADGSLDIYQRVLKYVGLLATTTVVVIVTRIARKALREAEEAQSGNTAAEVARGGL